MEQTLAEKPYDYIRKKLAGGDLPPGQRLVNRVLADEIGGSVIPVREAIHRLASEGLVEHVPGSGAFVRKTDPHDLDNLYVLRDALESCAAGEAARYITEHQLEELESILNEAQEIGQQIERQSKKHAGGAPDALGQAIAQPSPPWPQRPGGLFPLPFHTTGALTLCPEHFATLTDHFCCQLAITKN